MRRLKALDVAAAAGLVIALVVIAALVPAGGCAVRKQSSAPAVMSLTGARSEAPSCLLQRAAAPVQRIVRVSSPKLACVVPTAVRLDAPARGAASSPFDAHAANRPARSATKSVLRI